MRGLTSIEEVSGLSLGTDALADAISSADVEIARQLEESDEVQALVTALEEQYDELIESREGVLPVDGMIPTADELGAEFEKFLADRGPEYPGSA